MSTKSKAFALRKIARRMIDEIFASDMPLDEEHELVTSMVRQWVTYDGHAGIVTEDDQFWLKVVDKANGGFDVGVNHVPGCRVYHFMRDWKFDAAQVPDILHGLNVSQSAELTNRDGEQLRMWMDPKERSLNMESLANETMR